MTLRMLFAAGVIAIGVTFPVLGQDAAPPPGGGGGGGMGAMIAERFAEMDTDHDGVVTRAEFDAYRAKMRAARGGSGGGGGGGNGQPRAGGAGRVDLFDRLDTNHDGKVTREEAQAAAAMLPAR